MKNKHKLLLLIAVFLILIVGTYASLQPSAAATFTLTNPNSSDDVNRSDSAHRESSVGDNKTKTCLTCNGAGTLIKTIENYLTCPACDGAGKINCSFCDGSGCLGPPGHLGTDICSRCLGSGRQTCPDCSGKGYKSETVTTREKCPTCKSKVSV